MKLRRNPIENRAISGFSEQKEIFDVLRKREFGEFGFSRFLAGAG